jgi:hypothetical protein
MTQFNRQRNNRYNNRGNNNYQRNNRNSGANNFCDIPKCAVYATNFHVFSEPEARSIFYPEVYNPRTKQNHTNPEMYREEMYQAIRNIKFPRSANCEMYLRKFDLPNNGKSCFIHFGRNVTEHNTEQGEKIVNALFNMARKEKIYDESTGRDITSYFINLHTQSFGTQKMEIKEYNPNQKRGNQSSYNSSVIHSVNPTPFTRSRNESRSGRFSQDEEETNRNLQIVRNRNIGDVGDRVTDFVRDQQFRTLSRDVPRNQPNAWGRKTVDSGMQSGFQDARSITTSKAESFSQEPKSPIMVESTEMVESYDPKLQGTKLAWNATNKAECLNHQDSVASVATVTDTPKEVNIDDAIAESPSSSQKLDFTSPVPPAEMEISFVVNDTCNQPGSNHVIMENQVTPKFDKCFVDFIQNCIKTATNFYYQQRCYDYEESAQATVFAQIYKFTSTFIDENVHCYNSIEAIVRDINSIVDFYTLNPKTAIEQYNMDMSAGSNSSMPISSC